MDNILTISNETDSVTAVWFSLTGGKFLLELYSDSDNQAMVLDGAGNVIGSASRIYSDGWSVQTKPFGGYVPDTQIVFKA